MDVPAVSTNKRPLVDGEEAADKNSLNQLLFIRAWATAKPGMEFRAANGAAGKNPAIDIFDKKKPWMSKDQQSRHYTYWTTLRVVSSRIKCLYCLKQ